MSEDSLLDFIQSWDFTAEDILDYVSYIYGQSGIFRAKADIYDCCGTGGDGSNTFNISTAAAILAAACGVRVCKNGGRSTTSKSGSVDVLEALGYPFKDRKEAKFETLEKNNLAFISSPVSASLLAPVKQLCRKHKITSFLSLIGPLTNPVYTKGQVIGVGKEKWMDIMVDVCTKICEINSKKIFMLVQSYKDKQIFDEFLPCAEAKVVRLERKSFIREAIFDPSEFRTDFSNDKIEDLKGGNSKENAKIIMDCLEQKSSPGLQTRSHAIALNAGAILSLTGPHLEYGFDKALEALRSGKALKNWKNIIK